MKISSSSDLGPFVQDFRRTRGMTQTQLAEAAGVSRRWLAGFEAGKSTVELGLAVKTLDALGLVLQVQSAQPVDNATSIDGVLRRLDRRDG